MMDGTGGGGGDRTNTPETKRGTGSDGNVRFFPGVGPVDELIPMGSAARAPVASADDPGGGDSNVRVFPGVGPVDELIPMGSAARAPATSTDDDGADDSNVRVFPGVGPIDELIPMGPAEKAPVVATMNADAFWGEDSQFLHQAIEAPNVAAYQPVPPAGLVRELRGRDARTGSFLGRLLAPVALMFLCLAGVAFAFDEAGLWGRSPAAAPRTGGQHGTRGTTHAGKSRCRGQTPTHPGVTEHSRGQTSHGSRRSKTAKTGKTSVRRRSTARKSGERQAGCATGGCAKGGDGKGGAGQTGDRERDPAPLRSRPLRRRPLPRRPHR